MQAVYVQPGQSIDFVPSRFIPAGTVLVCNGVPGVVKLSVCPNERGALHLTGVYDIEKDSSSFTAGAPVFFNARDGTAASRGEIFLGTAAASAAPNARKVRVLLNFGRPGSPGGPTADHIVWQSM